jgi:hypothetical protein
MNTEMKTITDSKTRFNGVAPKMLQSMVVVDLLARDSIDLGSSSMTKASSRPCHLSR